jgi:ElaB/YqjD/DUF883 family membrane-anchored ribosome-binding protein
VLGSMSSKGWYNLTRSIIVFIHENPATTMAAIAVVVGVILGYLINFA